MYSASSITIRPFATSDIEHALKLWSGIEGLGLTESDSEEAIESFLRRNPGFSAIATTAASEVIGAVLCGLSPNLIVAVASVRGSLGFALPGWPKPRFQDAMLLSTLQTILAVSSGFKAAGTIQQRGKSCKSMSRSNPRFDPTRSGELRPPARAGQPQR